MSSSLPPRKRPGAPETKPPPTDFDEDAPTSVAPGKARVDMPREFDPGGALDDDDNDVTGVGKQPKGPPIKLPPTRPPGQQPPVRPEDDDDTAPTKDT